MGKAATTVSEHRRTDPVELSNSLRHELDWIVMKALEKDRTRRYETANDFARDIQRYLNDEAVEACPPSTVYRLRKFVRRNQIAVVATAAVSLALILGAGIATGQAIRATRAEKLAEEQLQIAQEQQRLAKQQTQLAQKQKRLAGRGPQSGSATCASKPRPRANRPRRSPTSWWRSFAAPIRSGMAGRSRWLKCSARPRRVWRRSFRRTHYFRRNCWGRLGKHTLGLAWSRKPWN